MLTEIRLENFKCFGRPTPILLAPISVFIGPNGSGKSTPIQALMLLKQSIGGVSLVTNGNLIKLGDFRDIVYKHSEESLVVIAVSTTTEKDKVTELRYGQIACTYPENAIRNIYFVPPMERGFGEPSYKLGERPYFDFSDIPSADRPQAVATTLKYREKELQDKLSQWYERITGIRVRFALREGRATFVESVTLEGTFNMVNEGFGSNQLAFLLGQLAIAPEDSTICIEEPEIHLHPRAQSHLAEVLMEVAKEEHKQLIITTHSEHILYRLLTAIPEGVLTLEDLTINYFEKKEGVAEVRKLEVDDKGRTPRIFRGEHRGYEPIYPGLD